MLKSFFSFLFLHMHFLYALRSVSRYISKTSVIINKIAVQAITTNIQKPMTRENEGDGGADNRTPPL